MSASPPSDSAIAIPARAGDDPLEYHELHVVEAGGGRLVAQIRNENKANYNETLHSESPDGGKTWSEPLTISGDGMGGDLGYPSTVELADGTLLTAWYETMKGNSHAVLRQAHWRV